MTAARGDMKPETGPVPQAHATPKEVAQKDEWELVEGTKYIYRNRKTGRMENRQPEPPVLFPPYFYP